MEPIEKTRDTIDIGTGIQVDVSSWIIYLKLFIMNNRHIIVCGTASPKFSNSFNHEISLALIIFVISLSPSSLPVRAMIMPDLSAANGITM